MKLAQNFYFKRLEVLNSTERKNEIEDVLFVFNNKENQLGNLSIYLLPIIGQKKISDKIEVRNNILKSLTTKKFFNENAIPINENDIALYFSFDEINTVDISYFIHFKENFYSTTVFDLKGKKILDAQYNISDSERLSKDNKTRIYHLTPQLPKKIEYPFRIETKFNFLVNPKLKENFKDFRKEVEEKKIKSLYHFTDESNLDSIIRNEGLYSWRACEHKKIKINKQGGNKLSKRLDVYHGLEDYVRLSFVENHPMMFVAKSEGRINNPIILKINPTVILWGETRFSNMNATKNGHIQGNLIKHFLNIKFEVIEVKDYFGLSAELRPYYQAEILVKSFISIEYIKNIGVVCPLRGKGQVR